MGTRRSALGGGALRHCDRDLFGLGSAEHGQLDAVARFGAAKCRYKLFRLRGFLTVERDDDVARLDPCLRSRTWRRDLHGNHTTGAVDSQQPGDFWGQGGGLNTDIRVAGGPGGQQLVGDVDDGRGRDSETEGYRTRTVTTVGSPSAL
jgi:hypothetical protein